MDLIGDELLRVLSELGLKDTYTLSVIQQKRDKIFGEFLANHLWPTRVHEGVLFINVSSRQMLLSINSLKPEILKKLSPYGIKDIKLKIGPVRPLKLKKQSIPKPKDTPLPEDLNRALQTEVKDPALRETIQKAIKAFLSRK
ncbi:MAG: DUF721 domain-containing protein [Nitrospirae bacterium]|nr:MAG: DUF721 domain-containing protein [Nitrospirota bacterium]